jgi:hypothetical protein
MMKNKKPCSARCGAFYFVPVKTTGSESS